MSIPNNENPASLLYRHGAEALSNAQLLSILLSPGECLSTRDVSLGIDLIDKFGHPSRLDHASLVELCKINGIGRIRASRIKAALELGRRSLAPASDKPKLNNSKEVAGYFIPFLGNQNVEMFCCALLDTRNRLMRHVVVATGTVNACFIHPREVYRAAVTESACAIILVHNHPSGELNPSDEDISLTRRVCDAGSVLGIRVLDHIIVARNGYFSFLDAGLLGN